MEWVETTGKTIEEAKEAALDQLGVDESEAEFEVLEEPKAGLFGRVRREARVRARVEPTRPRPKADRRERRRRPSGGGRGKGRGGSGGAASGGDSGDRGRATRSSSGASAGGRGGGGGRSRRPAGGAVATEASTTSSDAAPQVAPGLPAEPSSDTPTEPPTPSTGAGTTAPTADARHNGAGRTKGEPMSSETVSMDEQADIIEEFLEGLTDAFGVSADFRRETIDDEMLEVQVDAPDLGLLIGPKGQTLAAVQELARTVLQRKATGTYDGRVRIDIAGYRSRRRAALEKFTISVADQVRQSGTPKVLEPMSPPDRKVVHDTVNDLDGVATASEGTEPYRRVVIKPA